MPGTTFDIGSLAGEAASGILGIGLGYLNDSRQYGQQQKLQRLQMQGSKEMTEFNMAKQLQMWKDTNYKAQVEQMKMAGLNPGLLYGMSGGGGATTGQPSGQVQGATAPTGGREIQDMLGMGMQMQLLKAQKENIEADTAVKLGDAANKPIIGENIQTSTASLAQGIEESKAREAYTRAQEIMQDIQNDIQGSESNDIKASIRYGMRKLYAEMLSSEIQQNVDDKTQNTKIRQAQATLAQTAADAWLKTQESILPQYQRMQIEIAVKMMIEQNMREWDKMTQRNRELGQSQEMIDYNTAVPPELKEILDNIFIIPGGGSRKLPPVGFKLK